MAERSSKRSSSAPVSKKECAIAEPADTVSQLNLSPEDIPECAVCLQSCMHPVKLPCSHIFCFLCVKGAANQSRRCALCRQAIPTEYFNNPTLVSKKDNLTKGPDVDAETEHYSWYYEGRNGWWQYDERTNVELEESYNAKKRTFELLIAGYMYVIDLDNMVQMRRNDPSRRRRIKRDLVSAPKKGIAGLKIAAQPEGSAATTEEQQADAPETVGSAVAAGEAPPQQSGAAPKAKSHYGLDHTRSRTAGVGKDTVNVNLSSASADQYDADDDYDGTDDEDDNDMQWLGSNRRPAQRSRQERRAGSSHYARVAHDNRSGLEAAQRSLPSSRQHTSSGTRLNPQGLPIRHQRVSSAPETRSGSYDQSTASHSRSVHPGSQGGDEQALEHADTSGVDSAMHALHLSTPDETVYEFTTVPSQSSQGEVRQRRRRQQQNSDVAL